MNINQEGMAPVRGMIDQQASDGVLSGVISPNETDEVTAGDWLKLDATTKSATPNFVLAAKGDVAIAVLKHDVKKDTCVAGDAVEAVILIPGTVMWLEAGATILPGADVEDAESGVIQTQSAQEKRGVALDYGESGDLVRVILNNSLIAAS